MSVMGSSASSSPVQLKVAKYQRTSLSELVAGGSCQPSDLEMVIIFARTAGSRPVCPEQTRQLWPGLSCCPVRAAPVLG